MLAFHFSEVIRLVADADALIEVSDVEEVSGINAGRKVSPRVTHHFGPHRALIETLLKICQLVIAQFYRRVWFELQIEIPMR